jgi:integrase
MAVRVREKPKGSGEWWIFINHQSKRKSKKIGRDKRLAREVAEKIKAKLVLNELSIEKINSECPTLKEYAEMWLSLPHERKESTQQNYKNYLQNHVYPHIGSMGVDKIGRKDLKLLFDKISIKGVALSSCQTIKIPLNGVFDHAVDSELIEVNHLRNMKSNKKKVKYKVDPLTDEKAVSLLDEMLNFRNGVYYPPVLCLMRTGVRIGELQALQWADVDFETRLIDITKTWWRGNVSSTKSDRARKVDMSKQLAEVLRELKQRQWKKYAGRDVPMWVFAGPKGNVLCLHVFRNALNQCLEASGLRRIRIHDLRHTYATIRLLRGHNIGDVSYQLGHSDISTTYNIYTHWIPGKFKSEVDELDTHPSAPYAHPKEQAGCIIK